MNLNSFDLEELTMDEANETDGGLVWFVLAGACLLLSACGNGHGNQTNTTNGSGNTTNVYNFNTRKGDTIIHSHNGVRDTVIHK